MAELAAVNASPGGLTSLSRATYGLGVPTPDDGARSADPQDWPGRPSPIKNRRESSTDWMDWRPAIFYAWSVHMDSQQAAERLDLERSRAQRESWER
jgi:hypothetical protein